VLAGSQYGVRLIRLSAADTDQDRALFAHHATWIAAQLSWSPVDLAVAVHQRFDGSSADAWFELARKLGMLSPAQREAEDALADTLGKHRALRRRFSQRTWSHSIDRRVDWPRTLEAADLPIPSRYATAVRVEQPDTELTIELARLARLWSSILVDLDPKRAARLERAWQGLLPNKHGSGSSLSPRMMARLAHSNARAAAAIARGACARYLPVEPAFVKALADYLANSTDLTVKNADTLLEVTSAFAIARAAVHAGWELSSVGKLAGEKYPKLTLTNPTNGLTCTLSKDKPSVTNLRTPLAEAMGLRTTGGQPDVVVTFGRNDARPVVYLCDAKRNAYGDGAGYLASSLDRMLAYIVEYGAALDFNLPNYGLATAQRVDAPLATIFAWKDVEKIAGRLRKQAQPHNLLESDELVPLVMAFDTRDIEAPSRPDEPWVLKSWFHRLARVAEIRLSTRGANEGRNAPPMNPAPTSERSPKR
jgi:hypothetical protein